jgi:hypothetical protein
MGISPWVCVHSYQVKDAELHQRKIRDFFSVADRPEIPPDNE